MLRLSTCQMFGRDWRMISKKNSEGYKTGKFWTVRNSENILGETLTIRPHGELLLTFCGHKISCWSVQDFKKYIFFHLLWWLLPLVNYLGVATS